MQNLISVPDPKKNNTDPDPQIKNLKIQISNARQKVICSILFMYNE